MMIDHLFHMSWQEYVDSVLIGSTHIKQAAIFGHDGMVWATSPGFSITQEQVLAILKAFTDPSPIRANGILVGQDKYVTLRTLENSIYGRKSDGGLVCVKTQQCIIVATYDASMVAGEATKVVEGLGDYLIGSGY